MSGGKKLDGRLTEEENAEIQPTAPVWWSSTTKTGTPGLAKYCCCRSNRHVQWGCVQNIIHCIQNSMEAILACQSALSTKWLGWVANSFKLWSIHTGPISSWGKQKHYKPTLFFLSWICCSSWPLKGPSFGSPGSFGFSAQDDSNTPKRINIHKKYDCKVNRA